jgi:hypothetical protein|tara:strand:+ start:34 stop:213 length:180 start_codon:yes stop_codon:yes gene_type:complete
MSEYADGDYLLVLEKRGKVYYKDQLSFVGDPHLAISMFIRHSTNVEMNVKLKKRINTGV